VPPYIPPPRKESLESENARLKAEVERLTAVSEAWKKRRLDKVEAECINWADVEKENVRLKAEVERLTALNQKIMIAADVIDANNQRLTKAGDAMAEAMWYGDNERSIWVKKFAETDWNRAKEGKHS
jgi:hypothetical protein